MGFELQTFNIVDTKGFTDYGSYVVFLSLLGLFGTLILLIHYYAWEFFRIFTLNFWHKFPKDFYWFLSKRLYFDKLYNNISLYFVNWSEKNILLLIDRGILETIGPWGMSKIGVLYSRSFIVSAKGYINQYLHLIFVAFVVYLFVILL